MTGPKSCFIIYFSNKLQYYQSTNDERYLLNINFCAFYALPITVDCSLNKKYDSF